MKKYVVIIKFKECNMDWTLIENEQEKYFDSESEARAFFNQAKEDNIKKAEEVARDMEIELWNYDDEDEVIYYNGELLEDLDYEYIGEPTDGLYALVKRPKWYSPSIYILNGDGRHNRDFIDFPDDGTTVEIIKQIELTAEVMRKFGFSEDAISTNCIHID